MRVKVEECWAGGDHFYFRCTLPNGDRVNVGHNSDGDPWCREYAAQLRDYITREYGVKRNSIKVT